MGFDWGIKFPHDEIFCMPWYYGWLYFPLLGLITTLIKFLHIYYFDRLVRSKHMILKELLQGSIHVDNKKEPQISDGVADGNSTNNANTNNTQDTDTTGNGDINSTDNVENIQNTENIDNNDKNKTQDMIDANDGNMTALVVAINNSEEDGKIDIDNGEATNDSEKIMDEQDGQLSVAAKAEIAARRARMREMIENYTDSVVRELSSIRFVSSDDDDNYDEIRLSKDICKLIVDYTSHEYMIMNLLYSIRRKYYWKHTICKIIYVCYLYFRHFFIVWIFYFLIYQYVQFYKDNFGNKKWNGQIGWNAYVAFGILWQFNPMLKWSALSDIAIDENYKYQSEYLKSAIKNGGDVFFTSFFTLWHNFKWNKKGINMNWKTQEQHEHDEKQDSDSVVEHNIIKIDKNTNLIVPSNLENKDVMCYQVNEVSQHGHTYFFIFLMYIELFGLMLSIFAIMFPLFFVGFLAFLPLAIIFIFLIGIAMKIGEYCEKYFKYNHIILGQLFYVFGGYYIVWLFYSLFITCCVSIACLYQGNDWGNCFVYAFKADYCPNHETFWQDYYGSGYSKLSWNQKLFMFAWHVV